MFRIIWKLRISIGLKWSALEVLEDSSLNKSYSAGALDWLLEDANMCPVKQRAASVQNYVQVVIGRSKP